MAKMGAVHMTLAVHLAPPYEIVAWVLKQKI